MTTGNVILSVMASLFGLIGVLVGAYWNRKAKIQEIQSHAKEKAVDAAQDLLKTYQADRRESDSRFDVVEAKIDRLIVRDTILREFAWELITHINEAKPPPPPKWPDALMGLS